MIALYQCVELVNNYKSKQTIRKKSHLFIEEDISTPEIIVCSDPPHLDTKNNLISIAQGRNKLPSIRILKTSYKVVKSEFFFSLFQTFIPLSYLGNL